MLVSLLLLPILAAAAAPAPSADRPIVVTAYAGRPFISPMGEPFRARSAVDDALARWFAGADRNHDRALSPMEMQADAERFFTALDTDHNGAIDPEELVQYEWEIAPEIQVNAKLRRPRADKDRPPRESMGAIDQGLQGAARYALINMPEPVAAADVDLDRSITLAEFRQAGAERFRLLDTSRQGQLTLEGLKLLLPKPGRRPKPSADQRYGVPLPAGD